MIEGTPAHPHYFQPELNNSKAFIIQCPIYSPILSITNHVMKNEDVVRCLGNDMLDFISKHVDLKKKKNYNIGLVGTVCPRKGQLDFLNKVDPKIVSSYTFHIIGPTPNRYYLQNIINACDKKKLIIRFMVN